MAVIEEPVVHGRRVVSALKTSTLSLFDTTVIATSSVAPAYTLAATAAVLIAAVGLSSPAAILVGFFPVLFIAMAYYYLNRMDPNCGASYSWVSRTLNPHIGWLSGWVQLCANILFCAAAPVLAGAYTLQLLGTFFPNQITSDVTGNVWLVAAVAIAWLALVTFMVVRGIRVTANFQWALVIIEIVIVVGFSIVALLKTVGSGPATTVSVDWFNPGSLGGLGGVATGAALAVFFFWGWDTAANVNEETRDSEEAPGRAGIISMFILLFIFLLSALAIQSFLPQQVLNDPNNQGDILLVFAQQISSNVWVGAVMVLAILSSTVATTQTTLLPSSRLSFSMARDGVFPAWFGRVHPRWRTPWLGTIISSLAAALIILLTAAVSQVSNLFGKLILDIGVLVAAYYGVTGIASAWAFRRLLFRNARLLVFAGILPLIGGLFLFAIAGYVVYQDPGSSLPVLVAMGLGIPLLIVAMLASRSGFFREPTVSYTEVDGKLQAMPARTTV